MDHLLSFGDMEAFTTHRSITVIKAKHLAKDMGLEEEWRHFWNYNRAAGLSYHNRYHSCFMMVKCDSMAEQMGLLMEARRALCLAAMFHDFNHSGGVVGDNVNISNAVSGLIACNTGRVLTNDAIGLIQVTEFTGPGFAHKPSTTAECIIRDADILQGCTPFFAKTIYVDLFNELLVSKLEMTILEFRAGQEKFLREVEMFTEAGKKEKEAFLEVYAQPFWRRFDKWAI